MESLLRLMEVWRMLSSIPLANYTHLLYRPITKFPGGPVDKPLEEAAKRLGITTTQVIFLWLRSKGIVIVTYVLRLPFVAILDDVN